MYTRAVEVEIGHEFQTPDGEWDVACYWVEIEVEIGADDEDFWYAGAEVVGTVYIMGEDGEWSEVAGTLPDGLEDKIEKAGKGAYDMHIADWYASAQEP